MLRCVKDERAPTAANIKQMLARLKSELAAQIIELAFLCGAEVLVGRLEVRARIYHSRIKPETIKIIRNIIMKRHRAPVTLKCMSLASNSWQDSHRGTSNCR